MEVTNVDGISNRTLTNVVESCKPEISCFGILGKNIDLYGFGMKDAGLRMFV